MLEFIAVGTSVALFVGTYTNFVRSRKNVRDVQAIADRVQESDGLYNWAMDAVVVVRSKKDHTDVMRTTIAALYGNHKDGLEFRHASMLFQNGDFKVYAQSKPRA